MACVDRSHGQQPGQSQSPDLPRKWRLARQAVMFALGVAVIIDGLFSSGSIATEIVAGLVLIGLVPVDDLLSRLPKQGQDSPPTQDMAPPITHNPPHS